jgi:Ca2+-transporting ATPase
MKWPVPLLPIQLLWVNLITDSFPAFALGLEAGEEGIMNHKPRDKDEPIIDKRMKVALAVQSVGLTIAVLTSYRIGFTVFGGDSENALTMARTFCFITLIFGEMIRAYSSRTETKSMFKTNIFGNKYLNYSVAGALILLFAVIYTPSIAIVFSTTALNFTQLVVAVSLGLIPTVFSEISKLIKVN